MRDPRRGVTAAALGLVFLGCDTSPTPPAPEAAMPPAAVATRFDPAAAGRVRGRVAWAGDAPPLAVFQVLRAVNGALVTANQANPNAPFVHGPTAGVRGAVVFLREVEPASARPWDLPAVTVEQRKGWLFVKQGDAEPGRAGFVRRGDEAALVSRDAGFSSLRGRGDDFFTLAFPDPDRPVRRAFDKPGLIELTSAAGGYWMRAYLFVAGHPYYALTDRQGRFELPGVPAGRYELVCWHPSWHERSRERDPETGMITRLAFAPPAEKAHPVTVTTGSDTEVTFELSLKDFPAR